MARLGHAFSIPGRVQVTQIVPAPGQPYEDVAVIRAADLPSGTGAGKDYCVVAMGNVGRLIQSSTTERMLTRFGFRFGIVEEPLTWSHIEHLGNPISTTGFTTPGLGLPWQVVHLVRDWPTNTDLLFSAQHVRSGNQNFGYCELDNLCFLVFDLTAFGGGRVTGGWAGPRIAVQEALFLGGLSLPDLSSAAAAQLLNTGPLTWASGIDQWVAFWSQNVHAKSALSPFRLWGISPTTDTWDAPTAEWHGDTQVRARTSHVGTPGSLDGAHAYCTGTWVPFDVANATSSFRVRGGSAYNAGSGQPLALTIGGAVVALRIDTLDASFASFVPGPIIDAVGTFPQTLGPVQQYQADSPRDLRRWVSLARLQTAETPDEGGGIVDAPAVICIAAQNGFAQREALQALSVYRVIAASERLPVHCGVVTQDPRYAWKGGNFLDADWFCQHGARPPGLTVVRGQERCAATFCLSDDGPEADPPPKVYDRVVVEWDKEGPDISEIPEFLIAPSAVVATAWEGGSTQELVAPDGYRYAWGGPISLRRIVTVSWPALTASDVNTVRFDVDLHEVRVRKWQPKTEPTPVAWAIVPGTFVETKGEDGIYSAQVQLAELLWYGS